MILRNQAITFSWRTGREWIQWMDSFLHWALLHYWINSLSEVPWFYRLEKDELKKTENPTPILLICIWTVHSLRSCEAQPITCRMRKREKTILKAAFDTNATQNWKTVQPTSLRKKTSSSTASIEDIEGRRLFIRWAHIWESRRLVIQLKESELGL